MKVSRPTPSFQTVKSRLLTLISTGGAPALLVAERTGRFRAVFSFGPADTVMGYGPEYTPFAFTEWKEVRLRSPKLRLHSIRSPTFVFEGTVGGNLDCLRTMARASNNPKARFNEVKGATHFDLLAPTNELIARKLSETGSECHPAFTEGEVGAPFGK